MKIKFFPYIFVAVAFACVDAFAQPNNKTAAPTVKQTSGASVQAIKSSAAYAELLLRSAELGSILEDLLASYTEEFPKVKETRYEMDLIQKDLARLLSLNPAADSAKLTPALGKLLVRRAELQTAFWSLQSKYGEQHPEVQRAKRRAAGFEKGVAEILP